MNQKITLYHGSEQIIESPTFGLGKQNNDFGLGLLHGKRGTRQRMGCILSA